MDLVRHVPGRELGPERGAEPGGQVVVQLAARGRHHVQDQPALGAELAGVHHQAVGDLGKALDHAVELAGAHPDPAAVEGGVGAAVDDAAPVGQQLDPVAVPPDPGIGVEVAFPVPGATRIVPEADRHRRHRLGDDQLADLPDDRLAVVVVGLHLRAQAAAGDDPRPDGQQRAGPDEARAQVGAAREGAEQQILLDPFVDPAERLGGQRRSGRADGAQRGQVDLGPGPQPRLHAGHQVGRADPQIGDAVLGGQPPQPVRGRVGGAAVVQHDGQARQQAPGQVVPHHPAGRGVPGEDVAGPQVLMEGERLEVLEHDPAVAVHDRLGQARGARGVDHPERMVERHLLELGLALTGGQVLPAREPRGAGGSHRAGRADQVHHDHRGQARQGGHHIVDHLGPGELLASVPVAVPGDEHGRLDLREPVDDAAGAEVGRAG